MLESSINEPSVREKLSPWMAAISCGALSLITVTADIVGRFATGNENIGLTAFLCFLPCCFFHVGVMLKNLREENQELKRRLDAMLIKKDDFGNQLA